MLLLTVYNWYSNPKRPYRPFKPDNPFPRPDWDYDEEDFD